MSCSVKGGTGPTERTDVSFVSDAAMECTLEELMEDETHSAVVARHMMFFCILCDNRAKARGLVACKATMANTVVRP